MAATIRQVAAAAGVSIATASRALSGSDAVVESTRQRVLQVATELDYNPSRLARGLVTGSTGNVGVIVSDLANPFFADFLAELEAALGQREVGLIIGNSREDPEHELRLARRMATQVDALVLASSRLTDEQLGAVSARQPLVLVNRRLGSSVAADRVRSIVIDVGPGFTQAVRHLHELGHRRLTYIDGPGQSWSALQKRTVVSRVCGELGVALTVLSTVRPDFAAGRERGGRFAGEGVGAVLAYNDQVALGVLAALHEARVGVPDQVSVIGCDDALPEGLARPALTTVHSSSRALGASCAQTVLAPAGAEPEMVPTRLVIRGSTGRSAGREPPFFAPVHEVDVG